MSKTAWCDLCRCSLRIGTKSSVCDSCRAIYAWGADPLNQRYAELGANLERYFPVGWKIGRGHLGWRISEEADDRKPPEKLTLREALKVAGLWPK